MAQLGGSDSLQPAGLSERAWTPILAGGERERALEVVADIASDLESRFVGVSPHVGSDGWSLGGGRCGVALFFAYLGEALADDAARATAVRLVEQAIEAAATEPRTISLYGGFTGAAWTLAHLDGWLVDVSDEDPIESFDAALLNLLADTPWRGKYDLISGLVGIGVYALERLPRGSAAQLLSAVVARLAELCERTETGATWRTPPEHLPTHLQRECPNGLYNLGVAHGVPGVLALLGKACDVGVGAPSTCQLFDDTVAWLVGQRLPPESDASFAGYQAAPGALTRPARSAWCYGDPGIAAALLMAARHADSPGWEATARSIAERAAARPIENCGVRDACLCHGAGGLAHIFNRLYQTTGSSIFHQTALRWVQRILDERRPGTGVAGFSMFAEGERWSAEPGFLEGAAGIGLALLAVATPLEPRWDRLLLLS